MPFTPHWPTWIITVLSMIGGMAIRHYWWVWKFKRDSNRERVRARMERYSRKSRRS